MVSSTAVVAVVFLVQQFNATDLQNLFQKQAKEASWMKVRSLKEAFHDHPTATDLYQNYCPRMAFHRLLL